MTINAALLFQKKKKNLFKYKVLFRKKKKKILSLNDPMRWYAAKETAYREQFYELMQE